MTKIFTVSAEKDKVQSEKDDNIDYDARTTNNMDIGDRLINAHSKSVHLGVRKESGKSPTRCTLSWCLAILFFASFSTVFLFIATSNFSYLYEKLLLNRKSSRVTHNYYYGLNEYDGPEASKFERTSKILPSNQQYFTNYDDLIQSLQSKIDYQQNGVVGGDLANGNIDFNNNQASMKSQFERNFASNRVSNNISHYFLPYIAQYTQNEGRTNLNNYRNYYNMNGGYSDYSTYRSMPSSSYYSIMEQQHNQQQRLHPLNSVSIFSLPRSFYFFTSAKHENNEASNIDHTEYMTSLNDYNGKVLRLTLKLRAILGHHNSNERDSDDDNNHLTKFESKIPLVQQFRSLDTSENIRQRLIGQLIGNRINRHEILNNFLKSLYILNDEKRLNQNDKLKQPNEGAIVGSAFYILMSDNKEPQKPKISNFFNDNDESLNPLKDGTSVKISIPMMLVNVDESTDTNEEKSDDQFPSGSDTDDNLNLNDKEIDNSNDYSDRLIQKNSHNTDTMYLDQLSSVDFDKLNEQNQTLDNEALDKLNELSFEGNSNYDVVDESNSRDKIFQELRKISQSLSKHESQPEIKVDSPFVANTVSSSKRYHLSENTLLEEQKKSIGDDLENLRENVLEKFFDFFEQEAAKLNEQEERLEGDAIGAKDNEETLEATTETVLRNYKDEDVGDFAIKLINNKGADGAMEDFQRTDDSSNTSS